MRTANVRPLLSATPGRMRNFGGEVGEDNGAVYVDQLGHDLDELDAWKKDGAI